MKLIDLPVDGRITAASAYPDCSLLIAVGKELRLLYHFVRVEGCAEYAKEVELVPSSSFNDDIISIVVDGMGGRVALLSRSSVRILLMPNSLWMSTTPPELLKSKYHCQCVAMQENVYLSDVIPCQAAWTRAEPFNGPVLAVLASDCSIRFYNVDAVDGLQYPTAKLELMLLLPSVNPSKGNAYGLFKTIVDFCILSVSRIGWHLLVVDSDGDAYACFASSSLRIAGSAEYLHLPLDILHMEMIPHEASTVFTSLAVLSSHGVLSHLVVVPPVDDEEIDGGVSQAAFSVSVEEAVELDGGCGCLSSLRSACLVQSSQSLFFVDFSSSIAHVYAQSIDEEAPEGQLKAVECIRSVKEFLTGLPIAVECKENSTDNLLLAFILPESGHPHSAFISRPSPQPASSLAMDSTISSHVPPPIPTPQDIIIPILDERKLPVKVVGLETAAETELLSAAQTALSVYVQNVSTLPTAALSLSRSMAELLGRADAVERQRDMADARLLQLFQQIVALRSRFENAKKAREAIANRLSTIWNTLAGRRPLTDAERQMHSMLVGYEKELRQLLVKLPQDSLVVSRHLGELNRSQLNSSVARRNIQISTMADEIAALKQRVERAEGQVEELSESHC